MAEGFAAIYRRVAKPLRRPLKTYPTIYPRCCPLLPVVTKSTMASKKPNQPDMDFDQLPDAAFVGVETVAMLYSVTPATIWRWARLKKIPRPHKLGPQVTRWNVRQLRRALKLQTGRQKAIESRKRRQAALRASRAKRDEEILALWESGETYKSISAKVGVSASSVSDIVLKMRFRKVRVSKVPVIAFKPSLRQIVGAELIGCGQEGGTIDDLADRLQRDWQQILKVLFALVDEGVAYQVSNNTFCSALFPHGGPTRSLACISPEPNRRRRPAPSSRR